ncbi:hypothetical protein ACYJ1Y_14190 [Natrialbaceae archaeon A-gly3]
MSPTPPDEIPEFLIDEIRELPPEILRQTIAYAREDTYVARDGIPDRFVETFALQDDPTVEAICEYLETVADYVEEYTADSLAEVEESANETNEENDIPWDRYYPVG